MFNIIRETVEKTSIFNLDYLAVTQVVKKNTKLEVKQNNTH